MDVNLFDKKAQKMVTFDGSDMATAWTLQTQGRKVHFKINDFMTHLQPHP